MLLILSLAANLWQLENQPKDSSGEVASSAKLSDCQADKKVLEGHLAEIPKFPTEFSSEQKGFIENLCTRKTVAVKKYVPRHHQKTHKEDTTQGGSSSSTKEDVYMETCTITVAGELMATSEKFYGKALKEVRAKCPPWRDKHKDEALKLWEEEPHPKK